MTKAEEIIKLQEREENRNANFRTMWQDTADLIFPRDSSITNVYSPGTPRTDNIYDTTAMDDSKIMADGLLSALIPAGEFFFKFNVSKDNPGGIKEEYKEYLDWATDKQHRAMFASNFLLQVAETLRSLIVFGTGNIFSEWTTKTNGLNYRDYDIGRYQILENSKGIVDTMILKFPFTALQAKEEWGDKLGEKVKAALATAKRQNDTFWFIHLVRPRKERNRNLTDFLNMPFESIYVGVDDKNILDEGGFPEFPFHVPRWAKTSCEVMGRGIGTQILPQVRVLQTMLCDFIELGNKYVNPPREVLHTLEGEVDVTPGADNRVSEIPSTRSMIDLAGNFPVTDKIIEMQREVVHKAFYRDVWAQFLDLKGDRRTTVEIRARQLEGLRRMGQPAGRIQSELFDTLITRTLHLLIRNGEIPEPPEGLEIFEIEYLGLMANALSSGQARGFQQWAAVGAELSEYYPGILDNVNYDEGFRDLGRSLGAKAEHINKPEQRDEIRQAREERLQQQQLLEAAQTAGKAYKDTSGAPEEGSLAGELQNA